VVGVVCQPDKPAGRGYRLTAPPIKELAEQVNRPLLQPARLRTPDVLDGLRNWAPDLIVVAAYGRILPTTILALPRVGCINVHASLLPKYRGAAPIQWAILNGDPRTGITIMRMNERMDAGDILLQRDTPIGADETYGALQDRLAVLGAEVLMDAVQLLHAGALQGHPQSDAEATAAPMIKKEDGRIDWMQAAETIARRVRAFNPWPSAFTLLDGRRLKVHRAHPVPAGAPATPGTVTTVGCEIGVGTGQGALALDEVQLEGRRSMNSAEFSRGVALRVGTLLG